MSQAVAVQLKDNWSIVCNDATQYEGMKALLQMLGYTFQEDDYYSSDYTTICTEDFGDGLLTQGGATTPEDNHFENIVDFLVFHYEAQEEAQAQLEVVRDRIALIDAQLEAASVLI